MIVRQGRDLARSEACKIPARVVQHQCNLAVGLRETSELHSSSENGQPALLKVLPLDSMLIAK